MRIIYTDTFELPLPPVHRFPISKYRLLRERIASDQSLGHVELQIPVAASDIELRLVHDAQYLDKLRQGSLSPLEQRRIGFPWSPAMAERSLLSALPFARGVPV